MERETFAAAASERIEVKKGYRPPFAKKRPADSAVACIGDSLAGGGEFKKGGNRGSYALLGTFANRWPSGVVPYEIDNNGALQYGEHWT